MSKRIIFGHEERDVVKSMKARVGEDLTAGFKTSDENAIVDIIITHYALRSHPKISDTHGEL